MLTSLSFVSQFKISKRQASEASLKLLDDNKKEQKILWHCLFKLTNMQYELIWLKMPSTLCVGRAHHSSSLTLGKIHLRSASDSGPLIFRPSRLFHLLLSTHRPVRDLFPWNKWSLEGFQTTKNKFLTAWNIWKHTSFSAGYVYVVTFYLTSITPVLVFTYY